MAQGVQCGKFEENNISGTKITFFQIQLMPTFQDHFRFVTLLSDCRTIKIWNRFHAWNYTKTVLALAIDARAFELSSRLLLKVIVSETNRKFHWKQQSTLIDQRWNIRTAGRYWAIYLWWFTARFNILLFVSKCRKIITPFWFYTTLIITLMRAAHGTNYFDLSKLNSA